MKHILPTSQRFTYEEPSVELLEFLSEETLLCTSGTGSIGDLDSDNYGDL